MDFEIGLLSAWGAGAGRNGRDSGATRHGERTGAVVAGFASDLSGYGCAGGGAGRDVRQHREPGMPLPLSAIAVIGQKRTRHPQAFYCGSVAKATTSNTSAFKAISVDRFSAARYFMVVMTSREPALIC